MHTTTSDPSDSWSNHWSNGLTSEKKKRPRILFKRKLRLYNEFNINNQKTKL